MLHIPHMEQFKVLDPHVSRERPRTKFAIYRRDSFTRPDTEFFQENDNFLSGVEAKK